VSELTILQNIRCHNDLKKLDPAARTQLCAEIRQFLVDNVAKTGGHLASNLGVVELSVAIETVFDTAKDRLVFDVGHQSYIHKLLTGRQTDFEHLRQFGGMAGFPKPGESDTDAFVAGHASSSVSIALGMARARTLMNDSYHVVALLGDGAATGGMVYEGLNDAAESKEPMIVILNDNAMSIDHNVGGMARHLSNLRSKEQYLGMKEWYKTAIRKVPGGKTIYNATRSVKDWVKRSLIPTTIFDNMGLTYLGPVDGHDTEGLIALLRIAKDMKAPVLLHVMTHKGRGYKPAEDHPSKFHGIGKFDPETGKTFGSSSRSFSQAFGDKMIELASKNPRVCAITAAMPGGTGLLDFKQKFPKRLFDVGIAEEHAVSMAGGFAKQGMVPVVAIYSTFLQRAYDQILQDAAMLKLHVVFAVDRAGLVGEDGETHHGVFDVGFLRHAPGMTVLCPASCKELGDMLHWAVEEHDGPVAVRYGRGGDRRYTESAFPEGPVYRHRIGSDVTLITYGTLIDNAIDAAWILSQQGIQATVLRLLTVAPVPVEEVCELAAPGKPVVLMEETQANCGIGEALAYALRRQMNVPVSTLNLGDQYVTHGNINQLYAHCGLDGQSVANHVQEVLSDES
jgi:1-deoxy-D-xylulose-5-phosphate synthase